MGYAVCAVAATEEAAVADAARCKPDLMIVDQQLREGTGVSAVERILRNGPVPCVFISNAPVHLARPGANMLQKPFLEKDLVRAICYVVGGDSAPPALAPGAGHVARRHWPGLLL
jgi:DNA-binding NarL/FixJ family response regulator